MLLCCRYIHTQHPYLGYNNSYYGLGLQPLKLHATMWPMTVGNGSSSSITNIVQIWWKKKSYHARSQAGISTKRRGSLLFFLKNENFSQFLATSCRYHTTVVVLAYLPRGRCWSSLRKLFSQRRWSWGRFCSVDDSLCTIQPCTTKANILY